MESPIAMTIAALRAAWAQHVVRGLFNVEVVLLSCSEEKAPLQCHVEAVDLQTGLLPLLAGSWSSQHWNDGTLNTLRWRAASSGFSTLTE